MKYLKPYNESIRHLLKPKSEEDIKNNLLKIKPIDVLDIIKSNNLYHLFNSDEIKKMIKYFSNKYHYIIEYKLFDYFTDDELLKYIKMDSRGLPFILKNGVYFNRIGLVEYALSNNVNLNDIKNLPIREPSLSYTDNILTLAISKENIEIIKLLLDYGAKIDGNCYVLTDWLERKDIKKLLDKYNKTNESIRHLLKPKNDEDIIKSLKYNSRGLPFILKNGVYLNRIGLVEFALSNNANLNNIGNLLIKLGIFYIKTTNNILEYAISKGNIDIIKLLLDYGANITDECYNICRILNRNDIKGLLDKYNKTNESIRHLLKPKSNDDIEKSIKNLTPDEKFVYGCEYGMLSLVKDAVEKDKLDTKDFDYMLYSASIYNHIDVVEYLLKNTKVDPTIYNNASIENAYIENNYEMVKLLLNDDRVKDSLPKFKLNDYQTFLSTFDKTNESIRHLLKPKSQGDILKSIEKLNDNEKFVKSIKYNIDWLYNKLIDKTNIINLELEQFFDLSTLPIYAFDNHTKRLIDNIIQTNDENTRNYYIYEEEYSLYINELHEWYISKLNDKNTILIKMIHNNRRGTFEYYLCPKLEDLLDLLKRYKVQAILYIPYKRN